MAYEDKEIVAKHSEYIELDVLVESISNKNQEKLIKKAYAENILNDIIDELSKKQGGLFTLNELMEQIKAPKDWAPLLVKMLSDYSKDLDTPVVYLIESGGPNKYTYSEECARYLSRDRKFTKNGCYLGDCNTDKCIKRQTKQLI